MRRVCGVLLACALSGCAMVDRVAPSSEASPAVPAARTSADELFAYLARLRTLSESALATEAARQRKESGDLAKVKAAMALSLSPQAEESDILALVDPAVRKENADRDLRAMASFLHVLATERRRLKESAAATGSKLRDEKRTAETQKQRADSLQQKLDALTELERSLSDRPSPNR